MTGREVAKACKEKTWLVWHHQLAGVPVRLVQAKRVTRSYTRHGSHSRVRVLVGPVEDGRSFWVNSAELRPATPLDLLRLE